MDSGLLDSRVSSSLRPATMGPVRVWLLLGKYGGDNAQVRTLGEHLAQRFGWSCETRRVYFHPADEVARERIPDAIDFARSDSLAGPLPDLVISCGRFYGKVGAWLKEQAATTADCCRMVHVHFGRIAAPMSSFDLVAATAQYGLSPAPNFMPMTLPLVPHKATCTAASVDAWRGSLENLPRPWTMLLVGGPITCMRFDDAEADQLVDRAVQRVRAIGGAVLWVASRRTPASVRTRIAARLAAVPEIPSWSLGWPVPEPSPYRALLALGDQFVVTSDSASMIADACITGKPVELVRLPIARFLTRLSSRGLGLSLDARRRRRGREGRPADALDRLRDALVARHWMRPWDEMRDFLHGIDTQGLLADDPGDRAQRIQAAELAAMTTRIAGLVSAARRRMLHTAEARPLPAEPA
jgi:mitochondrial fission protein ELM1